jgi:SAM-dependent methyltransferase
MVTFIESKPEAQMAQPRTHPTHSGRSSTRRGPCPACGQETWRSRFLESGPHRIAICRSCGLGVLIDRPDERMLGDLYRSDLYAAPRPRGMVVAKAAHRIVNTIRLHALGQPQGRLLDVGAGKGHFLAAARSAGWDAIGVEYSESSAEEAKARYGLDVIVADYMTDPPNGEFDAVTMWHVLEHLPDPRAAVELARTLLVDGGRLLISVPNFASLQAQIFGPDWLHLDLPRHLYHFTPRSLARLLEGCGFRLERVEMFAPDMEIIGLVQSTLNRLGSKDNVALRFLKNDPSASAGKALMALGGAAMVLPAATAWSVVAPVLGTGASVQVLARRVSDT